MLSQDLLRQLVEDARQRAALSPMSDPEHDFYTGVMAAANDRLHPHTLEIHGETWLGHQSGPFREGYIKASTVIAGAQPESKRLMLPVHEGGPTT